jgi:hypothetical protein
MNSLGSNAVTLGTTLFPFYVLYQLLRHGWH